MSIENPPVFLQAGSHPAQTVRRMIESLVDATAGVAPIVGSGQLQVVQNTTPNMSVLVYPGVCFIAGTYTLNQGFYFAESRYTTTVSIAASNPTNPRKDIIIVRVRDSAHGDSQDLVSIEAKTGTPSPNPVVPAAPSNSIILAVVDVPANATAITNSNITDQRPWAYALGVAEVRAGLAKQANRMAAKVTHNANQSIATGTLTALSFNSEMIDTNSLHSTITNTSRITVFPGGAGLWHVGYSVRWATNGTGYRVATVLKNGSTSTYYAYSLLPGTSAGPITQTGSDIIRLLDNDYVEVRVEQTSGGALNVEGDNVAAGLTTFWAFRLGD